MIKFIQPPTHHIGIPENWLSLNTLKTDKKISFLTISPNNFTRGFIIIFLCTAIRYQDSISSALFDRTQYPLISSTFF